MATVDQVAKFKTNIQHHLQEQFNLIFYIESSRKNGGSSASLPKVKVKAKDKFASSSRSCRFFNVYNALAKLLWEQKSEERWSKKAKVKKNSDILLKCVGESSKYKFHRNENARNRHLCMIKTEKLEIDIKIVFASRWWRPVRSWVWLLAPEWLCW